MSRDPLQVWIPRPSRAGGAAGLPGQGRVAPRCPHRVREVPGATGLPSTGPWPKILTRLRAQKEPEAASPPATRWDRAPRERAEGERSVQVATSQQTGRTHTHAHTHHRVQQNAV